MKITFKKYRVNQIANNIQIVWHIIYKVNKIANNIQIVWEDSNNYK